MYKANKKITQEEVSKFYWRLVESLRGISNSNAPSLFAYTYALYLAQQKKTNTLPSLEDVIQGLDGQEDITHFLSKYINKSETWYELSGLYGVYNNIIIKEFLLFPHAIDNIAHGENSTPQSLVSLATKLLNINDDDTVIDFGSGIGTFLLDAYSENSNATYTGVEINTDSIAISKIRIQLLEADIEVEQYDMFSFMDDGRKYSKVFSNYPFGMRLRNLRQSADFYERISKELPELTKATSSDWIFNSLLVSSIAEDGKAIGIMTNGSTWNSIDKPIREFFVRHGYIETIIALPERMFSMTSIGTVMIVFSKNNETIRFVDARNTCQIGRRQNMFSESDIDSILSAVANDSHISCRVGIKELSQNDFALYPFRYMDISEEVENGVAFGDVIANITRGAALTASQLDQLASLEATDIRYLMLSNIVDGVVSSELPYLKSLEPRLEKYCIHDGHLLLSKNGAPFKVAVAMNPDNEKILANGNLYIVEIDEEKARPMYIKAFFESEKGIAALNRIAVGTAIPNISLETLKKLIIPLPPLDIQLQIEEKYLERMDEVKLLKLKLEKARSSLKNILEEG